MAEYKMVWVSVDLSSANEEVSEATALMNKYAADGWDVVSTARGQQYATWNIVFITFRRG